MIKENDGKIKEDITEEEFCREGFATEADGSHSGAAGTLGTVAL